MYESLIYENYHGWLCRYFGESCCDYSKILKLLDSIPFYALLEMDNNRIQDAYNLRIEYCKQFPMMDYTEFLSRPCSILEVMVALAIRCETIMTNSEEDRTGLWLKYMLQSLGLDNMVDMVYDPVEANNVIRKFLQRTYEPNGRGGLFYIPSVGTDLRQIDIWYQAMWYLSALRRLGVT